MPAVAFVTIWWLLGFNVLLFIAGLRNISREIYEAAELDGAGRWTQFRRITWPLIWPVTVLVFTIQLILQLKIFDQVYLFAAFIVQVRSDDGDGAVHLQAGVPDEQGRPRRGRLVVLFVLIVVAFGAAIPAAARARRAMTASRRGDVERSPRSAIAARRGCADLDAIGLVITLATLVARDRSGRFRSTGGSITTFKPENEIVRPGRASLAGAFHVRELRRTCCCRPRSASGTSIR